MIDLRSDTVTKPTAEMRKAMFEAEVGDDIYREDPTINKLEETVAHLLGKEAALFVTSGTQGNQLAILSHCKPGQEVIVEENSHVYYYEGGAMASLAGVQPRPLQSNRGALEPEHVQAAIRADDIHFPVTGLICLENTHNRAGGAIVPLSIMEGIYNVAKENHIPVHLDGARLFNTSVATNTPVHYFAEQADSVQVCLSKGLGAPVGSLIAGSRDFIERARRWRKCLGGGLRQAGVLAAPALVALDTMVDRLAEDHHHAKTLAEGLSECKGLTIESKVETNIVMVNVSQTNMNATQFVTALKQEGILANAFGPQTVRFVTHYNVSKDQINQVVEKVHSIVAK